jgi:hypothetical protein
LLWIMLLGATDSEPARITLLDFIGHEGARILTFFSYASGDDATVGADLDTLAQLVAQERLRPTVALTVDWQDIDRLLGAMRAGDVAGKALLTVTQPCACDGGEGISKTANSDVRRRVRGVAAVARGPFVVRRLGCAGDHRCRSRGQQRRDRPSRLAVNVGFDFPGGEFEPGKAGNAPARC